MREDDIVVTGLGAASSLHGVVTACAAARAGLARPRAIDGFSVVDEDTAEPAETSGFPHPFCTEGFQGAARRARLGIAALEDLLEYSGLPRGELANSALFLSLGSSYLQEVPLSGPRDTREAWVAPSETPAWDAVLKLLLRGSGLGFPARHRVVRGDEHPGSLLAVGEAVALLRARAVERCLIGGIDSFLERGRLETLSGLGLLKTPNASVGFMPGEAAAFFLLERYGTARRRGARVEAVLGPVSEAHETLHRFADRPSVGMGLAEAMQRALGALEPETPGLLIHNLNGDPWRAMEWGSALVRLSAKAPVRELPLWVPAESFGETGAATGALSVCMGVRAFARGYAGTRHILVAMSSYEGRKACLVLSDVIKGGS